MICNGRNINDCVVNGVYCTHYFDTHKICGSDYEESICMLTGGTVKCIER